MNDITSDEPGVMDGVSEFMSPWYNDKLTWTHNDRSDGNVTDHGLDAVFTCNTLDDPIK